MRAILTAASAALLLFACGSQPAATQAEANVVMPKALELVQPPYPEEARKAGVEGTSIVDVTVGANGVMTRCSIAVSSGNAVLDEAALQAVHVSKFAAGTKDGKPVEMKVQIPFRFKLGDSQKESRGKAPGSTYRAGWSDEPQCREARVPALPAMEV